MTAREWAETHPCGVACASDRFYSDLVNRIEKNLIDKYAFSLRIRNLYNIIHGISLRSVFYLEDMVSGTCVWQTMREMCRKRYGKVVPFYPLDDPDMEYLDDEVNIQDLKFIIWHSMSRVNSEYVYYPDSEAVELISKTLFDILTEEWEKAPEAARVRKTIQSLLKNGEFLDVRQIMDWLTYSCPLTAVVGFLEQQRDDMDDKPNFGDLEVERYGYRCMNAVSAYLPPLGCSANEYVAELAGLYGLSDLAERLRNFRSLHLGVYRCIGENDGSFVFESVYPYDRMVFNYGKKYLVSKESFSKVSDVKLGYYSLMSIVEFDGIWNVNGFAIITPESKLDETDADIKMFTPERLDLVQAQSNVILKKLRGSRFAFFKSMEEEMRFLGVQDIDKSKDIVDDPLTQFEDADNITLYIAENGMTAVVPDLAEYLKSKKNPFYNREIAEGEGMSVIMENRLPYEALVYAAEKGMFDDFTIPTQKGKRFAKRIVRENTRFFVDYYNSKKDDRKYFDTEDEPFNPDDIAPFNPEDDIDFDKVTDILDRMSDKELRELVKKAFGQTPDRLSAPKPRKKH